MEIVCILQGGPDREIIDRNGKRWIFEDHPQCGPAVVTPVTREIAAKQPSEKSAFWDAVTYWYEQGQQIENGLCVWKKPPTPKMKHLGGRHWLLLPD